MLNDGKQWSTLFLNSYHFIENLTVVGVQNIMFKSFGLIFDRLNLRVTISSIPGSFLFLYDWSNFNHVCIPSSFSKSLLTIGWVSKPWYLSSHSICGEGCCESENLRFWVSCFSYYIGECLFLRKLMGLNWKLVFKWKFFIPNWLIHYVLHLSSYIALIFNLLR